MYALLKECMQYGNKIVLVVSHDRTALGDRGQPKLPVVGLAQAGLSHRRYVVSSLAKLLGDLLAEMLVQQDTHLRVSNREIPNGRRELLRLRVELLHSS